MPRKGCYGDMNGSPGVRNYGTMDLDDLYDVYCYIEEMQGKKNIKCSSTKYTTYIFITTVLCQMEYTLT